MTFRPSLRVTDCRELPRKASRSMVVTVSGRVSVSRFIPRKASAPITSRPGCRVTVRRFVQPARKYLFRVCTLPGMSMAVRLAQYWNAFSPM